MKNLEQREGFKNRHTDPLPDKIIIIKVILNEGDRDICLCEWEPPRKNIRYHTGYLGTARKISGDHKGIGFNVWEQNNSEFIYYQEINI